MENPYHTEAAEDKSHPIVADLYVAETVAETPPSPSSPPQPGILLAIGLALTPLVSQMMVGVGVMALVASVLVARGVKPEELIPALSQYEVYLLPVGTFTTLLVACGVAMVMLGRNAGRAIGWRGFTFLQLIGLLLFIFPLAILGSEATNIIAALLTQIEPQGLAEFRKTGAQTFDKFSQLPFLLVFVAGCLLPGLGEEILCRGVISRGLIARYGVLSGTVWASFLFGAMHLEPVQAFGAFVLGLGLQYVFLATRSLAAPIFCHAVNNSFAFILMKFHDDLPIPGISSAPDEGLHIPLSIIATSTVALVLASAFLFQIRTRWVLQDGKEWTPNYVSAELPPRGSAAIASHGRPSIALLIASVVAFTAMMITIVLQIR